jgi:hypothetical protein
MGPLGYLARELAHEVPMLLELLAPASSARSASADAGLPTYVFAWNPKLWGWPELPRDMRRVQRRGHVDLEWSSGRNKNIEPGSRAFFVRLGVPPKGLIGAGYTLTAPEGRHSLASREGRQGDDDQSPAAAARVPRRHADHPVRRARAPAVVALSLGGCGNRACACRRRSPIRWRCGGRSAWPPAVVD